MSEFKEKIIDSLNRLEEEIKKCKEQIQLITLKVHKVILYCKKCGKPFRGYLLNDNILQNSQHPELYELCEECTPAKLMKEIEKYHKDFEERYNKIMINLEKGKEDGD